MKKTYEACPDFMREHRFEIELPVASEDLGQAWSCFSDVRLYSGPGASLSCRIRIR